MAKKPQSNALAGSERQFPWPDHVRSWRVSRFDACACCDWNPPSSLGNKNGCNLEAVHVSAGI